MIATTEAVDPKKKMKIKCGINRTEASAACKLRKQVPSVDSSNASFFSGKKRGPETELDGKSAKRMRMDRSMALRCSTVLGQLMNHPAGWIFSRPVDPVALNIPDYFEIISEPMDLGTVKDKLHKNMYSGPESFAADVKLTFSNAMLYNPPGNNVHIFAKKLSAIFEARWNTVGGNGFQRSSGAIQEQRLKEQIMGICGTREHISKRSPLHCSLPSKSFMASEKVEQTLNARAKKVEHPKIPETCIKSSSENSLRGTGVGGKRASGLANAKQRPSSIARKCYVCGNSSCRCSLPRESNFSSSSYRSLGQEHKSSVDKTLKQDCHPRSTSAEKMSKSNPDSDRATSASGDESLCSNDKFLSVTTDDGRLTEEYTPIYEIQLSPTKALRAAMLKSRFADTILKARQKTRIDNGDKEDPVKLQQEKQRLERIQHEEKARIEAQIRASKVSAIRIETELRKQRQKEREAARLAIEKMERTVAIEDNMEVLKELEMLSGCSLSYYPCKSALSSRKFRSCSRNLLEKLGLYVKYDYFSDEDEQGEEGEILQ